jgi:hypothetical protein
VDRVAVIDRGDCGIVNDSGQDAPQNGPYRGPGLITERLNASCNT